jgi:Domain of unknown function (DUF4124)
MTARCGGSAVFVAAGLLCAGAAGGQEVQRCESPTGKVTYSNTTCPTGTEAVRTVETEPPPSEADRKAAIERARQRSRELDRLEHQRQKEEEKAARDRAAADAKHSRRDAECRRLEARVREARLEFENATLQRRQLAGRKLQTAEEQAAACRKS